MTRRAPRNLRITTAVFLLLPGILLAAAPAAGQNSIQIAPVLVTNSRELRNGTVVRVYAEAAENKAGRGITPAELPGIDRHFIEDTVRNGKTIRTYPAGTERRYLLVARAPGPNPTYWWSSAAGGGDPRYHTLTGRASITMAPASQTGVARVARLFAPAGPPEDPGNKPPHGVSLSLDRERARARRGDIIEFTLLARNDGTDTVRDVTIRLHGEHADSFELVEEEVRQYFDTHSMTLVVGQRLQPDWERKYQFRARLSADASDSVSITAQLRVGGRAAAGEPAKATWQVSGAVNPLLVKVLFAVLALLAGIVLYVFRRTLADGGRWLAKPLRRWVERRRQKAGAYPELRAEVAQLQQKVDGRADLLAGQITALAEQVTVLAEQVKQLQGTLDQEVDARADLLASQITALSTQVEQLQRTLEAWEPPPAKPRPLVVPPELRSAEPELDHGTRIVNLDRSSGLTPQSMPFTESRHPNDAVSDRVAGSFVNWCKSSENLKINSFLQDLRLSVPQADVTTVYRDANRNDGTLYFTERAETASPVDYWLVSTGDLRLLFPFPESAARFRELAPSFEGQGTPRNLIRIEPARVQLESATTLRRIHPGRLS